MFSVLTNPLVIGIAGAALAIILVAIIVIRRYRIASPDQAIIVTGRGGKTKMLDGKLSTDLSGQKVVTGGGVFVLPFVQKSYEMSLRSRQLAITTTAQTSNGITIQAQAVAVVKVGGEESMIRAAAQRFLSQQEEIESSTQEVLSGSLRGIIGSLTVENIIQDRAALASAVLGAAEDALTKQGLVVDTLQIQEIRDSQDYIVNLGRPEAANVRRKAEVADTEATRAAEEAKIDAEKIILNKNRELQLQQATIQQETDKARAEAQAAKPLEDAIQRQKIVAEEEITATKEAALKEQQLNADIRKVADAEAYRIKAIAEAEASALVSAAEGNAKAEIATADAERQRRELAAAASEREGIADRESRKARAEAVAAEGAADASAIEARGAAEASAIEARGKALENQAESILAQQALEVLPRIAAELAKGYGSIDNLTVVSTDGANKLTGDIVGNVAGVSEMLKSSTGIDIAGIIGGITTGAAAGAALGKARGSKAEVGDSVPSLAPVVKVSPKVVPAEAEVLAEAGTTIETQSKETRNAVIDDILKKAKARPVLVPTEVSNETAKNISELAEAGHERWVETHSDNKDVDMVQEVADIGRTAVTQLDTDRIVASTKTKLGKIEKVLDGVASKGLDYTRIPQVGAIRNQLSEIVGLVNSTSGVDMLDLLKDYPRITYLISHP